MNLISSVKQMFGFSKKEPESPKIKSTITDKDRVEHWAYHHCERENSKWLGTDPTNICPLQGTCPSCREKAFEAILG